VTAPDPKLVKPLGQAQQWHAELRFERELSLNALAERHGVDSGDISRILPFAFLAPDVSEAILEGRQPTELTAARLNRMNRLPLSWPRSGTCSASPEQGDAGKMRGRPGHRSLEHPRSVLTEYESPNSRRSHRSVAPSALLTFWSPKWQTETLREIRPATGPGSVSAYRMGTNLRPKAREIRADCRRHNLAAGFCGDWMVVDAVRSKLVSAGSTRENRERTAKFLKSPLVGRGLFPTSAWGCARTEQFRFEETGNSFSLFS
jgi:hypothetical protein